MTNTTQKMFVVTINFKKEKNVSIKFNNQIP